MGRFPTLFLMLGLCCSPAAGATTNCGVPLNLSCPSAAELRQAERAFRRAGKLSHKGLILEALEWLEEAARLVPYSRQYALARELGRQQAAHEHLRRGNQELIERRQVEALAEFRQALELDPANQFAAQRMRDALDPPGYAPNQPPAASFSTAADAAARLKAVSESSELELQPQPGKRTLRFRGDSRELLDQAARLFGLAAFFDESVAGRRVRMEVENVDFFTAMKLAGRVTRTFWVPLSEKEMLVLAESQENRRLYEPMSARTFYLTDATSTQELNDFVSLLRIMFDIRFIAPQPAQSSVVVRAPKQVLDAAARVLDSLRGGRPQVLLDVQAFELNATALRQAGIDLPLQFRLFNVATEVRSLLGQPGIQSVINQLFSSGGINQPSPAAIAALLAQLRNQANSLVGQPIASFGGGITRTGIVIPAQSVKLNMNQSLVTSLEHAVLRAGQGSPATLRSGTRFPILNASFAPIFNSPALAQVLQNRSFLPAFPSFSYEDLGLTLKAKPRVLADLDIFLELELQIKALGAQTFNSVPVITNREYKSTLTLKEGETAVVLGAISQSETRSLRGLPGWGRVPLLGRAASTATRETADNQLMIVITPHVVRLPPHPPQTETWLPSAQ